MMDGMFSSLLDKKKYEWGIDRNLDDVACRSGFLQVHSQCWLMAYLLYLKFFLTLGIFIVGLV